MLKVFFLFSYEHVRNRVSRPHISFLLADLMYITSYTAIRTLRSLNFAHSITRTNLLTTYKIGKRDLFIFIAWVWRHSNFQTVYSTTRYKPSSSVQFENENDVTPGAINMNRSRLPILRVC